MPPIAALQFLNVISESSRERASGLNSKTAPFPVLRVMSAMLVDEAENVPLPKEKRGIALETLRFAERSMRDTVNEPVSAIVKREVVVSEEVST